MTKSDLTQKQLIAACRKIGMVAKYNGDEAEWCVNFKGGRVETTYYTTDKDDALDTAIAMRLEEQNTPESIQWGAEARDMRRRLKSVRENGVPTGHAL